MKNDVPFFFFFFLSAAQTCLVHHGHACSAAKIDNYNSHTRVLNIKCTYFIIKANTIILLITIKDRIFNSLDI